MRGSPEAAQPSEINPLILGAIENAAASLFYLSALIAK